MTGPKGSRKGRVPIAPGTPPVAHRTPGLRVEGASGGLCRVVVCLGAEEVEVTQGLTAALAHALWQLRGGEDVANWVGAESLLAGLLSGERRAPSGGRAEVIVPKRTAAVAS